MGDRGRTSGAELSVVGPNGIETVRRPEPLSELSDEQAVEWRAIVNRMPADWFPRETWSMLVQLCRHIVRARRLDQLLAAHEAAESVDIDEYDKLLKMQERESRAIMALSRSMRLTQQATYDPERRKSKPTRKPWDG